MFSPVPLIVQRNALHGYILIATGIIYTLGSSAVNYKANTETSDLSKVQLIPITTRPDSIY